MENVYLCDVEAYAVPLKECADGRRHIHNVKASSMLCSMAD